MHLETCSDVNQRRKGNDDTTVGEHGKLHYNSLILVVGPLDDGDAPVVAARGVVGAITTAASASPPGRKHASVRRHAPAAYAQRRHVSLPVSMTSNGQAALFPAII